MQTYPRDLLLVARSAAVEQDNGRGLRMKAVPSSAVESLVQSFPDETEEPHAVAESTSLASPLKASALSLSQAMEIDVQPVANHGYVDLETEILTPPSKPPSLQLTALIPSGPLDFGSDGAFGSEPPPPPATPPSLPPSLQQLHTAPPATLPPTWQAPTLLPQAPPSPPALLADMFTTPPPVSPPILPSWQAPNWPVSPAPLLPPSLPPALESRMLGSLAPADPAAAFASKQEVGSESTNSFFSDEASLQNSGSDADWTPKSTSRLGQSGGYVPAPPGLEQAAESPSLMSMLHAAGESQPCTKGRFRKAKSEKRISLVEAIPFQKEIRSAEEFIPSSFSSPAPSPVHALSLDLLI